MLGSSPSLLSQNVVRFAAFEADLRSGELRKQGVRIKLQERPFRILALLLEQPGDLVTREQLRQRLWAADTFVDFDHSLGTAMAKLRQALGDSAQNPRFVETIGSRGYRFIAPVVLATAAHLVAPAEVAESGTRRLDSLEYKHRHFQRWIASVAAGLVGGALLVSVFLGFDIAGSRGKLTRITNPAMHSLAVLPLANLSGDPEQEYFSDGMTEELITNLGKIADLRVISHTSVTRYKNTKKPLSEIAKELQVEAVVEGTVARSGDHVRVTANLIQAFPERHLWAESYDRDLRDVLSLQSELARAITSEVKVKLTPIESVRLANALPVNPEAYQLYLKGRYFWNKRTKDGLNKALEYFNQAVAIDPNYALAYAGIAECYSPFAYFGYLPPNEAFPKAREAAMRALAIDDTLAEAHSAWAAEKQYYEWDWAGAEREFKRAIELNPNYATAHSWYAQYLISAGRVQEGLAESKQALLFDPFSLTINNGFGHRLYWAREYDQAIEQCQKTRELEPNYGAESWTLALAMEQKGELKKAIAELRSNGSDPENTFALASLGHAYALSGNTAAATAIVRALEERSRGAYLDPLCVAWVYAGLAKKDQAFASLQKAAEQHSPLLTFLKVEPILDPLRSDPRFAALMHQMGL